MPPAILASRRPAEDGPPPTMEMRADRPACPVSRRSGALGPPDRRRLGADAPLHARRARPRSGQRSRHGLRSEPAVRPRAGLARGVGARRGGGRARRRHPQRRVQRAEPGLQSPHRPDQQAVARAPQRAALGARGARLRHRPLCGVAGDGGADRHRRLRDVRAGGRRDRDVQRAAAAHQALRVVGQRDHRRAAGRAPQGGGVVGDRQSSRRRRGSSAPSSACSSSARPRAKTSPTSRATGPTGVAPSPSSTDARGRRA